MQILLIEDDEPTAAALIETLTAQRYFVSHARDGQMGYEMAQGNFYDLLLLDIVLPKLDGITLCRRLRSEKYQVPILLLTAQDTSTDRVMGLDAGADDYVVKPFDLPELLARIRALVRRGAANRSPLLTWGSLALDPISQEVTIDGTVFHLTRKEYGLLELFLQNPKRAFSRGLILDRLWAFDESPGEDTVTTHIKGLRQKLKQGGIPDPIETVYGLGYRLRALPETASSTALPSTAPPEEDHKKVTIALQKIWERSQPDIAAQLQSLEMAQIALQSASLDAEVQHQAKRDAHKLAGSVGIFGFSEGSRLARDLETILMGTLTGAEVSKFQALLTDLRQALAQPLPTTGTIALQSESPKPLVLLVGKENGWLESLSSVAASRGLQIQAIDSPQVKREMAKMLPDAVLLNLSVLEPAEGLPLLADLRTNHPSLPILVILGQDSLEERVEIARRGAYTCLQKPISADRIIQTLLQALQSRSTYQAKVLVVDDDPLILNAVQALLEPWGIQSVTLQSSQAFWEVLNQVKPDLLVLDIEMPDFNGIELCQVVRNDSFWGNLPIVALTAHTDAETIQQMFAAGADDFISKPFVGPELVTRILSRIERVRGQVSAPNLPSFSSV
ncbi:MAG: response regulator [Leptolyngbyaceae cyanobacterium bins.59]|nr:response regulator [Leptolyngbyaceae cyanobacterium bins.59]